MTVAVTHTLVAVTPSDPAYEIQTQHWNEQHTISGLGTLAGLNAVDLTANVTGILPWANGGTNAAATPGAGQVIYSDGTKYTSDANLTWSATTGLLSKKGISSKGSTNGTGTELFGLGASDACTLATTNNTISGAGAAQNGNNGFETNNSIYGQGSTISSAASSCLFGQGISLSALFSVGHTIIGQGISVASGNAVTITGAANSANQQTVINGAANSVSASGTNVGVFGTSNSYTNKYGGLFGSNLSSYRDNELGIGYVDGSGATAIPFSLSFSGTTGAFSGRQILRIGSAWIDATDATRKARALFYVNDTAEREYMRADAAGAGVNVMMPNLKLGDTTAATAILQLIAGTATANTAPLKFTSGTKLTTAEAGVHEYNGNHYLTNANIRFPVGGTLFDHYADANNGTTVETDLYTDTLAASTLANNGDKVLGQYQVVCTGAALASQEMRIYFGGTLIYDSGALSIGAITANFTFNVTVIRETSSVVRCMTEVSTDFATLFPYSKYTRVTGLTLSNTQIIKITGQASGAGGGSNQITASMGYIDFQPAA